MTECLIVVVCVVINRSDQIPLSGKLTCFLIRKWDIFLEQEHEFCQAGISHEELGLSISCFSCIPLSLIHTVLILKLKGATLCIIIVYIFLAYTEHYSSKICGCFIFPFL